LESVSSCTGLGDAPENSAVGNSLYGLLAGAVLW
jgi:hypothetical protein